MDVVQNEESSINRRPMFGLLTATGFAWFGNVLSLVVVPWLVYQITGSGALTGVVGFAAALPLVLAGIFGGVFIDRIGHARTAVYVEILSGVFLALIPILHMTTGLSVWAIAVLVFISNSFSSPGMTARRSLIPEVAPPAGMSLERANSLEQMFSRLPQVLGPAVAGGLMAVFHPANVIWLAVGVVWLSALSIYLTVRLDARPEGEETGSYVSDLVAGFRFVMQDRLIRTLALVLAFTNLLEAPLSIVMTVHATETLGGSIDLGIIMASLGVGLIVGVGAFAWFGHRLPRRLVFVGGLCGIGASYWILATLPGLWITAATLFALGLIAGPVNPLLSTIFHERVPAAMRGRVFGLVAAIALSMMPLGRLLGGMLIDAIGLSGTILVQAVGFAGAGVVMIILPTLKQLNEPADQASDPGTPAQPAHSRHSQ